MSNTYEPFELYLKKNRSTRTRQHIKDRITVKQKANAYLENNTAQRKQKANEKANAALKNRKREIEGYKVNKNIEHHFK